MRDVVDGQQRVVDRFVITKEDGVTARGTRATLAPPGETMGRGGGQ